MTKSQLSIKWTNYYKIRHLEQFSRMKITNIGFSFYFSFVRIYYLQSIFHLWIFVFINKNYKYNNVKRFQYSIN